MKKLLSLLALAAVWTVFPIQHLLAFQNYVVAGSTYQFPDEDDLDWGQNVTDWAGAVTNDLNNKTTLLRNATSQILSGSVTSYAPALATAQSTAALLSLISNGTTNSYSLGLVLSTVSVSTTQVSVQANAINIMGCFYTGYSTAANLIRAGPGGLDVGNSTSSLWYGVFAMSNGTCTQSGVVLSASTGTDPVSIPSGFTKWRRVGYVRTNSNAQIIPFRKYNYTVWYSTPVNLVNGTTLPLSLTTTGSTQAVSPAASSAWFAVKIGDLDGVQGSGARIHLRNMQAYTGTADGGGTGYYANTAVNKQFINIINLPLASETKEVGYKAADSNDSSVDSIVIDVLGYMEE